MDVDGDISEHEESGVSGTVAGQPLGEIDSNGGGVGEEQAGDGESDTELDLLAEAETESDSDDNHSNQDAASAQRSVQTGATAGSDGGMGSILLFPEDESGESSQQEDDESEAGETDEQDNEDFQIGDDQLERRRYFFLFQNFFLFFNHRDVYVYMQHILREFYLYNNFFNYIYESHYILLQWFIWSFTS